MLAGHIGSSLRADSFLVVALSRERVCDQSTHFIFRIRQHFFAYNVNAQIMYARKMADTDKEAARKSTRKPIHYAYICLLCSVSLAESKERRAVKGRGTFDIYGAIKSMPWEINVCEKSYVCRKCEARLKKKVNLEEALSKLLEEIRGFFLEGG